MIRPLQQYSDLGADSKRRPKVEAAKDWLNVNATRRDRCVCESRRIHVTRDERRGSHGVAVRQHLGGQQRRIRLYTCNDPAGQLVRDGHEARAT